MYKKQNDNLDLFNYHYCWENRSFRIKVSNTGFFFSWSIFLKFIENFKKKKKEKMNFFFLLHYPRNLVVIGVVLKILPDCVKILILDSSLMCQNFKNLNIKNENIYGNLFTQITLKSCFCPGDIIVCEINPINFSELKTDKSNLGVCFGLNKQKNLLSPKNCFEMIDHFLKKIESRKVLCLNRW